MNCRPGGCRPAPASPMRAVPAALILLFICSTSLSADEQRRAVSEIACQVPAAVEAASLAAALSGRDPAPGEIPRLLLLAREADRQRRHVYRSAGLSWLIPGLGHALTGERAPALAFGAADALIGATAFVLGLILLPPAVRPANLAYLRTPVGEIRDRFDSVLPAEYIPALAVGLAGATLRTALRALAARDAAEAAVRAIRAGSATLPHATGGLPR